MFTRRFLRVKAFRVLFSYAYSDNDTLPHAEKELKVSLEKTYDLYHFLFSSIVAISDYAEERINIGLKKFKPTEAEAKPNRKFINNKVTAIIKANESLQKHNAKQHLNWKLHLDVVRQIYKDMIESAYYKNYMTSGENSFHEDLSFVKEFFKNEFEDNPVIESMIEEMSIHWIDDIGFVLTNIIRILGLFPPKEGEDIMSPPMFRIHDDEEYVINLLRHSLGHFKIYSQLAFQFIQNWESDRIALVDMALIVMGISEAIIFPSIPVKVTINEYVEIAKYYSTHNSHIFINGVLDKMIRHLIHEGSVKKSGRGLIENTINKKRTI